MSLVTLVTLPFLASLSLLHPHPPGHPHAALWLARDFRPHRSGYFPLQYNVGKNNANVSAIPDTDPQWCHHMQHPLHEAETFGVECGVRTLSTSKQKIIPQSDWGKGSMVKKLHEHPWMGCEPGSDEWATVKVHIVPHNHTAWEVRPFLVSLNFWDQIRVKTVQEHEELLSVTWE